MQGAESQMQRQQDTKDKRRRDDEQRHTQQITREVERQARLQASMPQGKLTIEVVQQLPEAITVLFLAANPRDTTWIGLDEEIRLVDHKLRASEHRDAVTLKAAWAVRPDDLLQALNRFRPHVVHFAGHGNEDEIALQDADGNSKPISTDLLVQLMQLMIDNVRLVVFNTCQSRTHAEAVITHVDVAIGMNASIDDEAARVFSAQLYSAVGFGRSVQQAFEQARLELQLQGIPGAATPELFVRPGVDPDQVFLVRP
jgi:CHAT domain-containing protein